MWTWVSRYQNVSILDFTGATDDGEMVVTTGARRHAKFQSNCHHQHTVITLHTSEAAAQCIVITPVCLFVCGSVTTITRNCVHRSSPNWVAGKGSDHLQLIKFWPSRNPGKGSVAG